MDSGQGLCLGDIHGLDFRMGMSAVKNLAVQHARKPDILDIFGPAHGFLGSIQLGNPLSHDGIAIHDITSPDCRLESVSWPAICFPAAATESRI